MSRLEHIILSDSVASLSKHGNVWETFGHYLPLELGSVSARKNDRTSVLLTGGERTQEERREVTVRAVDPNADQEGKRNKRSAMVPPCSQRSRNQRSPDYRSSSPFSN